MTLKQTPLNAAHRAMGAKMVDFGGWDMPVNYGSQIDEHHQVRNDCGMFDVCHMRVVDAKGEGIRAFLRYLLANNAGKLTLPGKALYSAMLRPDGGVIDDLIIYFMSEQWFRIVVNAGTADKDIAWMKQQAAEFTRHLPSGDAAVALSPASGGKLDRGNTPITITSRDDLAMVAVQGPNARAKVWQVLPQTRAATEGLQNFQAADCGEYFVARTGYTGEDGFEVMLPKEKVEEFWYALNKAGVKPIGLGARDTLRLEAGMNLYGQDMDESVGPLESGLAWTVDLKSERDFIGKAALLASPTVRKLVGLVLLDRGVLRGHQKVHTAHGEGEITSGSFSPTLEKSIALARVPKDVQIGDTVQVAIRDKMLAAKVVKYPFARKGKAV
ncbi:MAG: glycine cleavage system aminomethyltransferase T [Gallionellales bacterium RIFCSPLOWO2_02_FULL_57_47]|nr:MAG: glycine cleavage system aminomethyltransferase T [Gallionellales bacterium RIFCSPLOWO2_02_FULL_57_47]OGT08741.1 MAG: glycine cleavage system aminomethyltransferase T [Gallionellales bacterium RIFCSPHIGHO2_02_FULL_57_16]